MFLGTNITIKHNNDVCCVLIKSPSVISGLMNRPSIDFFSSAKSQLQGCAIRTNTFICRYINQAASCVDSPFRHGPGEGRTLNVTPGAVSQDAALFANEQSGN
ncbi:hypothetical protein TNCT_391801 [Trichonephila clavata]|uniref:Uncharacterized protein n=1 Tax=Trichonephila clavata TaxID=2740835 RepID=A0A8X6HQ11_TRICU|nr:hypothetical protein TNCT_391801 [Trichonephila clavata]